MNISKPILILITMLGAVILFHLAVMVKLVSYGIAWGGRLETDSAMYIFESFSVLINLFLIFVLMMKGEYLKFKWEIKTTNRILWAFLILFLLNTVGNIFAKTNFEKFFAIVTLVFSILIWVILKNKRIDIPKVKNSN